MIKRVQITETELVVSGYALVTSMLLLLVLATLGVSMYGNVTVQEQMASNVRVKNRTFITADSILQSNWTLTGLGKVTDSPIVESGIELYSQGESIAIDGEVSVCFFREEPTIIGYELNADINGSNTPIRNHSFMAESVAKEEATHAETRLAQGGFIPLPSANKTGNCDTDGDSVPDEVDKCPEQAAPGAADGCP